MLANSTHCSNHKTYSTCIAILQAVDPDSGRQMIRRIEDAEAALASCRADAAKRIEARDQLIAELEVRKRTVHSIDGSQRSFIHCAHSAPGCSCS